MAYENGNQSRELSWDDVINKDSEFILLPDGEYEFKITDLEKSRYDGGDKLPPCPMAIVTCEIETPDGTAHIKNRLFLSTQTEGILTAFFASIGLKKKGEPLRMQWNKVVGATGRCKVTQREYNGSTYNEIKRFLPAPGYDQQGAGAAAPGGWAAGRY